MRVKYAEVVTGPSSLGIRLKLGYLWFALLGCQEALLILRRELPLCRVWAPWPDAFWLGFSVCVQPVRDGRDSGDECLRFGPKADRS